MGAAGRVSGRRATAAGVVSASVALGAGELLSGISGRFPSMVLSVADVLITETPGGLVRWSIRTFGASQKTVLVTGIVTVSLLLGALLGVAGRRRRAWGVVGFA